MHNESHYKHWLYVVYRELRSNRRLADLQFEEKKITGDSFQTLEVNADLKLNGGTEAKSLSDLS